MDMTVYVRCFEGSDIRSLVFNASGNYPVWARPYRRFCSANKLHRELNY